MSNRTDDPQIEAELEIGFQDGVWAHFKITNLETSTIEVIQPWVGAPIEGWEHSRDAYQVAVLQSFHILKITVRDEAGAELSQREIYARAHPILRQIHLSRGNAIDLSIPLDEFYLLEGGVKYLLVVQYDVNGVKVSRRAEFRAK